MDVASASVRITGQSIAPWIVISPSCQWTRWTHINSIRLQHFSIAPLIQLIRISMSCANGLQYCRDITHPSFPVDASFCFCLCVKEVGQRIELLLKHWVWMHFWQLCLFQIGYVIAFAFELLWLLESEVGLPVSAALLCAHYFIMSLFAAFLVHGLATVRGETRSILIYTKRCINVKKKRNPRGSFQILSQFT